MPEPTLAEQIAERVSNIYRSYPGRHHSESIRLERMRQVIQELLAAHADAASEEAEKDLYAKMVVACPEQNMLEHSGKHTDPWERLTSFVNASRQERHDLKAKVQSLEAALELTAKAMDVLGIKEKDAEIERLQGWGAKLDAAKQEVTDLKAAVALESAAAKVNVLRELQKLAESVETSSSVVGIASNMIAQIKYDHDIGG